MRVVPLAPLRATMCTMVCATLAFSQQKPPAPVHLTAQDVVQLHTAWGVKMNSPGSTLKLKEVVRQGNTLSIQFIATGLPRNHAYNLVSFPTSRGDAIVLVRGISLDASGRAMCSGENNQCAGNKQKSTPFTLRVAPAVGEPLRLGLAASDDSKIAAFVNETPFPLIGSDRGCRLEAVILDPRTAMLHVIATGMPANSSFTLTSDSGGKATVMNLKADQTGRYSTGLMPTHPTTTIGTIQLKVLASTCRPTLTVPYSLTP